MEALLKFAKVSYAYQSGSKQQYVLKNVSADFEKGRFYTIIGPSGSGKTTFLSLAGALDLPSSGKVIFAGQDISELGLMKFRNKYVSMVFQAYNLLPYMTALQNVMAAMEITGSKVLAKREVALNMLNQVGISKEQAKQKVLTLSGGQQQRVAIARALSCQADLIIADEPTGNLDEETATEIVAIFKRLAHEENKCIIMVTHNQDIAKISDVTLKLAKGNVAVVANNQN